MKTAPSSRLKVKYLSIHPTYILSSLALIDEELKRLHEFSHKHPLRAEGVITKTNLNTTSLSIPPPGMSPYTPLSIPRYLS